MISTAKHYLSQILGWRDILVIDAGTCITYEFIDSKGQYHGGNISPGMQMRFKARCV